MAPIQPARCLTTPGSSKSRRNGTSASALFIFVSEDGSISGWNPTLDETHAIIAVDNGNRAAIYKGATLGVANGHNFLYATNFHTGKVETFDENFHPRESQWVR